MNVIRGLALNVLCALLLSAAAKAQITQVTSPTHTVTVGAPTPSTATVDVANPLSLSGNVSVTVCVLAQPCPRAVITAFNGGNMPALMGQSTMPGQKTGDLSQALGGVGTYGLNNAWLGTGVLGEADSGYGVSGFSGRLSGVRGQSGGQIPKFGAPETSQDLPAGVTGVGVGDARGVVGISDAGNGVLGQSASGYGVSGEGGDIGVYAHNRTTQNIAVYLATRSLAGDFYGNVFIHGTLTKSAGSFRIDHPLDPEHKYLQHSFVESPDMMDMYNGNITLDSAGQAVVQMPAWFEALNGDFRYQLTPIGIPAPNLYIATEISGNRFVIAGGRPGGRVSWQVTGIRHDAYANAHRIRVEENKSSFEAER